MQRFSAMWSDKLGTAIDAASTEPYPIEMHNGDDFAALCLAVNQGIDSHLEAIDFKQSVGGYGRTRITLEPQSVSVLVRRLLEDGDDALAGGICQTLGIELV